MGRLIYDENTELLIKQSEYTLSEASRLLLQDAYSIVENTPNNIFIGVDLNDKRYHTDLSTMIISEVTEDKQIIVHQCLNEENYLAMIRNSKVTGDALRAVIKKLEK